MDRACAGRFAPASPGRDARARKLINMLRNAEMRRDLMCCSFCAVVYIAHKARPSPAGPLTHTLPARRRRECAAECSLWDQGLAQVANDRTACICTSKAYVVLNYSVPG